MRLVKTPRRRAAFRDLSRITLTTRADRVSEKGRSPASRGRNKTCSWKLAKWSPGKKARKKNFPESSRPQFRNNSRYDVTSALKWKPSARSSRRRRCYYSAKVKMMPVVCGTARFRARGRYDSKFLTGRSRRYICPRCFAKRSDLRGARRNLHADSRPGSTSPPLRERNDLTRRERTSRAQRIHFRNGLYDYAIIIRKSAKYQCNFVRIRTLQMSPRISRLFA